MTENNEMRCAHCGKPLNPNKMYAPPRARKNFFCDYDCYEASQARNKDKFKPEFQSERRDLTDYIQNMYIEIGYDKRNINWSLIAKQIKNLKADNPSFTDYTILYILTYMHEIKGMNLITEESHWNPMGWIEYYAKEAETYYIEDCALTEQINSHVFLNEVKKVPKGGMDVHKKIKQIDITKIF